MLVYKLIGQQQAAASFGARATTRAIMFGVCLRINTQMGFCMIVLERGVMYVVQVVTGGARG